MKTHKNRRNVKGPARRFFEGAMELVISQTPPRVLAKYLPSEPRWLHFRTTFLLISLLFLSSLNFVSHIIFINIDMDYYNQGQQPQGQGYSYGAPQNPNNGLPPGWIQEWDAPDNRYF